jgi:hypothetical protein
VSTPNQLSDTPRTDLAWAKTFEDDDDQGRAGNAATDMRDKCATLERELAALTAERDQLRAQLAAERERLNYIDSLSPGSAWSIYHSTATQSAEIVAGDSRTLRKLPGIRVAIDASLTATAQEDAK